LNENNRVGFKHCTKPVVRYFIESPDMPASSTSEVKTFQSSLGLTKSQPDRHDRDQRRYLLRLLNAEGVVRSSDASKNAPNPLVEVSLENTVLFTSPSQQHTFEPVWNQDIPVAVFDLSSQIQITVYHVLEEDNRICFGWLRMPSWSSAFRQSERKFIGLIKASVKELLSRGYGTDQDISLEIKRGDINVGVVKIQFMYDDPPETGNVVSPAKVQVEVPELSPDFTPPSHPDSPGSRMQFAGYRDKDISEIQVENLVQRVLARASEDAE